MLRSHDLPAGTFVRYVGNRLHVVFHLAEVLVLHWNKLKDFVSMQCTAGGQLRSSIGKDLSNEAIMAQVWALGVIGKIFSGPWMTKFYSSNMSNLEMRPLVQRTEKQLQAWIEMPQSVMVPTVNVFGEGLSHDDDDVLSSLQNFVSGEVEVQSGALLGILQACLTVLQRQLREFLTESELPSEVRDSVSSAPTHNMASERSLGCVDKMVRRAPVATGGFINGKVRSKLNKCTQWLDSLSCDEQAKMINVAIRDDRARKCLLTVSYWGVNDSESSSVDYSVSIFSFFADAVLGAITFL